MNLKKIQFVSSCKKREEHKLDKMDGASKFTSFKKDSEIMFRPVTPPPGLVWMNDDMQKREGKKQAFEELYGDKTNMFSGRNIFSLIQIVSERMGKIEEKIDYSVAKNGGGKPVESETIVGDSGDSSGGVGASDGKNAMVMAGGKPVLAPIKTS